MVYSDQRQKRAVCGIKRSAVMYREEYYNEIKQCRFKADY